MCFRKQVDYVTYVLAQIQCILSCACHKETSQSDFLVYKTITTPDAFKSLVISIGPLQMDHDA